MVNHTHKTWKSESCKNWRQNEEKTTCTYEHGQSVHYHKVATLSALYITVTEI